MAHIVARIQGGFEHARIHRYQPLRIWLTPADYCQLCDNLPRQSHHKFIEFNGIPVTLDRCWGQPSRLVLATGHRIIF